MPSPSSNSDPNSRPPFARPRGSQKTPTKQLISLRVDRRVLDHDRVTGPGWQGRINAALLKAAGLD